MLVLLTRPQAQSERTAERLTSIGHRAIIDPVLEVVPVPVAALPLEGVAAVAISSANAVHALASVPRDLPVYTVGQATAVAVQRLDGRRALVAEGDGAALARLIMTRMPRQAGDVLHLGGAQTSRGLPETLAVGGFGYRHVTVYEARPVRTMRPESQAALGARQVDAVLLYSPRSARLWLEKVRAHGLIDRLDGVMAACLSPAVAAEIEGAASSSVRVAATPDEPALLRCLEAPG